MKKFSMIGVCAITLILVALLAMPAIAAAPATVVHYQYNGGLVPDEYPAGAWDPFYLTLNGTEYYSDRGKFHIDAYPPPLEGSPDESYGIGFLRAEPSLAITDKIIMETRMKVEMSGGWDFDFILGILDGERAVPVLGQLDPPADSMFFPEGYNIMILISGPFLGFLDFAWGNVALSELNTYRLEVEKGGNVTLFCNDQELNLVKMNWDTYELEQVSVQYGDLLNAELMTVLIAELGGEGLNPEDIPLTSIAIGCYSSHMVYDYVALHAWSVPSPVELPSPGR